MDAIDRSDLREADEFRLARLEAHIEHRIAALETRLNERLGLMEFRAERPFGAQTRWLFVAWLSLLVPIVGLWIRPR